MTVDPSDIQVLMPDAAGDLAVCGLVDLLDRLVAGEDLLDAVDNSAIDTIRVPTGVAAAERAGGALEEVNAALRAVAQLNRTGDAAHYWRLRQ